MPDSLRTLYRLLFSWMEGAFTEMWDIATGGEQGFLHVLLANWPAIVITTLIAGTVIDLLANRTVFRFIAGVRGLFAKPAEQTEDEASPQEIEHDEPDTWREGQRTMLAGEDKDTTIRY